jgi:hypothetical protein
MRSAAPLGSGWQDQGPGGVDRGEIVEHQGAAADLPTPLMASCLIRVGLERSSLVPI